ncbi:histidine kinase [Vibrio vulnificus]|uniref:sensor histidine kinase n=1 Tax=Vibrio vulnificus TaxID=672 RepID=UPI0009B6121B|nr:histidine kinase [Vibrio vulnificus]OQK36256.1 signal transduction protein [Vibrio vulnificus]OQK60916.1 signal transduction protein [Vibrio vulnificus]OQK63698.1 signal transduction protein [Vibrio vulnificus]POC23438.1 sensor histidine kinase [Vibrio vulnificus]POF55007.1 sensor histidine kinase [Vibrio vulnificus]
MFFSRVAKNRAAQEALSSNHLASNDAQALEGGWLRSFAVTSIFCLFVSVLTLSVWGGAYYIHLIISFGFGYSALFFSWLIEKLFPMMPRNAEILLSLTACLLFGILNARFWVGDYFGITDMVPVGLMGLLFSGMCYFYFHSKEQQMLAAHELEVMKREKAEQERALLMSQLKQLQSQIEPHFLFNTLANISALMSCDVEKAQQMLTRLTDLLRSTLKSSREERTLLASELEILDAYLAIQKIRLGERLEYHIHCPEALKGCVIPPMLLQPLVENAITHGIEPKVQGGKVEVRVMKNELGLELRVVDTGVGFGQASRSGSGVGLNNIKQRLATLFGELGTLTLLEGRRGGVCAVIQMPPQQENQEPKA